MLPVFNDITTIDDTIIFYLNYHSDCFGLRKEIFDQGLYTQDNEILLLSQIQNEDLVIEKYIQKLKQHNEFEAKIGRAACQVNIEKAKEKLIDSIQYLKYNKKYLALANEYKIRNTEILKNMFVEDGLAQLAPVIGMDSSNLLFSAEDDINDESAVFLDFKKAGAKKEKKLTLNTAFKHIFGDGLKVQGFQVVKGRYPYLVRVINDEILHVISIRPRQAEYPEDKAFSILGGIATVYRKSIDLDTDPMGNYHWLRNDVASFYLYSIDSEPDRRLVSIMSKFNYFSEVPKSLPCVMEEALEYSKKYIISYMNETNTLEKCIDYFVRTKLISTAPIKSGLNFTSGDFYDDGLIYLKTNYKHHKEKWEEIIERKKDISEEKYNKVKEFYKFFSDDEYIQGLANELERRKQKNLSTLENIGIDI